MKRAKGLVLALSACCLLLLGAQAPVQHTRELYVNDYANVLSPGDRQEIVAWGRTLEQQTGAQAAVLTVDSLNGQDVEGYAYDVASGWGLGKTGEDNGVLILLSTGDRMSRIEVGYGLEGTLTDVMTGRVQDSHMLPHYQENDFSTGLREGYGAICALIYQHYGLEIPDNLPDVEADTQTDLSGLLFIPGLLLLFILFGGRAGFLPFLFFPRGGPGGRSGGGGTFGGGGGFGGGGSSRRF